MHFSKSHFHHWFRVLEVQQTSLSIVNVQDPSGADFGLVDIILTARKLLIPIDCKSSS